MLENKKTHVLREEGCWLLPTVLVFPIGAEMLIFLCQLGYRQMRVCCSVTSDAGASLSGCLQLQPCPQHWWEPGDNLGDRGTKDRRWVGRCVPLSLLVKHPPLCHSLGPFCLSSSATWLKQWLLAGKLVGSNLVLF